MRLNDSRRPGLPTASSVQSLHHIPAIVQPPPSHASSERARLAVCLSIWELL